MDCLERKTAKKISLKKKKMAVYKIMMYENKRRMVVLSPIHLSCRDLEELFAVSPPPKEPRTQVRTRSKFGSFPFFLMDLFEEHVYIYHSYIPITKHRQ